MPLEQRHMGLSCATTPESHIVEDNACVQQVFKALDALKSALDENAITSWRQELTPDMDQLDSDPAKSRAEKQDAASSWHQLQAEKDVLSRNGQSHFTAADCQQLNFFPDFGKLLVTDSNSSNSPGNICDKNDSPFCATRLQQHHHHPVLSSAAALWMNQQQLQQLQEHTTKKSTTTPRCQHVDFSSTLKL